MILDHGKRSMILAPGRQGTGEGTESEVLAREDGLKGRRETRADSTEQHCLRPSSRGLPTIRLGPAL